MSNTPETAHYVYKFVLDGTIIYIGKSNRKSFNRINQHGKPGDNIPECGWNEINKSDIYYSCLPNGKICDIFETELIRRYQPKYNARKTGDWNGLDGLNLNWTPYRLMAYEEIDKLNKKICDLEDELRSYKDKLYPKCLYCEREINKGRAHINNLIIHNDKGISPITLDDIIHKYKNGEYINYATFIFTEKWGKVSAHVFTSRYGHLRYVTYVERSGGCVHEDLMHNLNSAHINTSNRYFGLLNCIERFEGFNNFYPVEYIDRPNYDASYDKDDIICNY